MILGLESTAAEGWQLHLESLRQQLHENASDQCLLWIDPAQDDPFAGDPLVEGRRVRVPIAHANFDIERAPYLVPLDIRKFDDADVLERSVAIAWRAWNMANLEALCGQPVSGWIVTSEAPDSLAQHWATHCHVHSVNRLGKFLRFQDPSVREWLWPELSQQQQCQLLGGAQFVIAFGRNQALMTHASPDHSDVPAPADAKISAGHTSPMLLTSTQWARVIDYAAVHKGWLHCCSSDVDFRHALSKKPYWEKGVLEALRHATTYGLSDPQDRAIFAAHALQMGEDFHRSEKMKPIWEKTQAGEHYGTACDDMSGLAFDQFQRYLQDK